MINNLKKGSWSCYCFEGEKKVNCAFNILIFPMNEGNMVFCSSAMSGGAVKGVTESRMYTRPTDNAASSVRFLKMSGLIHKTK